MAHHVPVCPPHALWWHQNLDLGPNLNWFGFGLVLAIATRFRLSNVNSNLDLGLGLQLCFDLDLGFDLNLSLNLDLGLNSNLCSVALWGAPSGPQRQPKQGSIPIGGSGPATLLHQPKIH